MLLDAILFDLDGTLLPMDNDEFTKGYFALLAKAVAPYGYSGDTLIPAMWKGVAAMVKNDGSRLNSTAFWEVCSGELGQGVYDDIAKFDNFYSNEFNNAVVFTKPTPLAKQAVELARQKAKYVVLATNPLFPEPAVHSRLNWAGLSYDDFDLVTHYSNWGTCKPNPVYYTHILEKIGAKSENSLMVGNNAGEDAAAAKTAGLSAFLITDYLIGKAPSDVPNGSFEDLINYLQKL